MNTDTLIARMKEHDGDREWIKQQQKDIRNKISGCLVMNGFKKAKRSLFVRLENDLIVYFTLEHPLYCMYINFCIYPLFMPPVLNVITHSIGNRLEKAMNDPDMVIHDVYTMDEVDVCCNKLTEFVQNRAYPFIHQIDTAQTMVNCLESTNTSLFRNIVRLTNDMYYDILMHAELLLHQYEKAYLTAEHYYSLINCLKRTEDVKQLYMRRYLEVITLVNMKNNIITDTKLNEWREQNTRLYTGKNDWRGFAPDIVYELPDRHRR